MNEHFIPLNPSKQGKLQELIYLQHKLTLMPKAHINTILCVKFGLIYQICVVSRQEYSTKLLNLNQQLVYMYYNIFIIHIHFISQDQFELQGDSNLVMKTLNTKCGRLLSSNSNLLHQAYKDLIKSHVLTMQEATYKRMPHLSNGLDSLIGNGPTTNGQ